MAIMSKIRKQGGAAVLTIPPALLKLMELDVGAQVTLSVERGKLVAEPAASKRKRYSSSRTSEGFGRNEEAHCGRGLGAGWRTRRPRNRLMVRSDVPRCGDVYWIDPNPVSGREMKDRHRFVVITPRQINALGVSMTVPITTAGAFARNAGLAVMVSGHETSGVAVCNQVRSFDIAARVRAGSARFIETLDKATMDEIVARVVSAIDPRD